MALRALKIDQAPVQLLKHGRDQHGRSRAAGYAGAGRGKGRGKGKTALNLETIDEEPEIFGPCILDMGDLGDTGEDPVLMQEWQEAEEIQKKEEQALEKMHGSSWSG
eukprot:5391953-Karenia_brevis.AAC.1